MLHLAESFSTLMSSKMAFWLILGSVAIVAILSTALTTIIVQRGKEKTRREIAAYLAEGSIDKDTALAMLKADEGDEEEEEEEES